MLFRSTKALIKCHITNIANQPGLREVGIQFDDDLNDLIEELARRYRQEPASARNLKALLNQVAYPFIKRRLVHNEH